MAKRKTIHDNPLDALVPDPMTPRTSESPAAADSLSLGSSADSTRTITSRSQPKARDKHAPAPPAPTVQPPSTADLFNRVQSLEQENAFIRWLVGGTILLAVLL